MRIFYKIKNDFTEYKNLLNKFRNDKYILFFVKNEHLKNKIVFISLSAEIETQLTPIVENKLILENRLSKTCFFFRYKQEELNTKKNSVVITIVKK